MTTDLEETAAVLGMHDGAGMCVDPQRLLIAYLIYRLRLCPIDNCYFRPCTELLSQSSQFPVHTFD